MLDHNDSIELPVVHSGSNKTPDQYAAAVFRHAQRSYTDHLLNGYNHRKLAAWLIGPIRQDSTNQAQRLRQHDMLVIHDLTPEGRQPATSFDSVTGLADFNAHPLPGEGCGQLVFIRGHPSPAWMKCIGARYRIDPEYFRRHLTLHTAQETFDLPGPASSLATIARISTTTIGTRDMATKDYSRHHRALADFFTLLGTIPGLVGESIVRKYSVHDSKHFTIEQDISITVLRRKAGWVALVALDSGRDLDDGPSGPWGDSVDFNKERLDHVFTHTTWADPHAVFHYPSQHETQPTSLKPDTGRPFFQSTSLLPGTMYGQFLNPTLMRVDPFYALQDVFHFVAASENQFLNMVKRKYEDNDKRTGDIDDLEMIAEALMYHKDLLSNHLEQLQSTIEYIMNRSDVQWYEVQRTAGADREPSPPERRRPSDALGRARDETERRMSSPFAEIGTTRADRDAMALLREFNRLRRKAKQLLLLHNDSIEEIRTGITLAESRKAAISQQGVARLTFLAFLFIPLTFTTAIFGMSFEVLSSLHISTWLAVSIPVFLSSLVLCFWSNIVESTQRMLAARRRVPGQYDV